MGIEVRLIPYSDQNSPPTNMVPVTEAAETETWQSTHKKIQDLLKKISTAPTGDLCETLETELGDYVNKTPRSWTKLNALECFIRTFKRAFKNAPPQNMKKTKKSALYLGLEKGAILCELGQYAKGIKHLDKPVFSRCSLSDENASYRYQLLARAYWGLGKHLEAANALLDAHSAFPECEEKAKFLNLCKKTFTTLGACYPYANLLRERLEALVPKEPSIREFHSSGTLTLPLDGKTRTSRAMTIDVIKLVLHSSPDQNSPPTNMVPVAEAAKTEIWESTYEKIQDLLKKISTAPTRTLYQTLETELDDYVDKTPRNWTKLKALEYFLRAFKRAFKNAPLHNMKKMKKSALYLELEKGAILCELGQRKQVIQHVTKSIFPLYSLSHENTSYCHRLLARAYWGLGEHLKAANALLDAHQSYPECKKEAKFLKKCVRTLNKLSLNNPYECRQKEKLIALVPEEQLKAQTPKEKARVSASFARVTGVSSSSNSSYLRKQYKALFPEGFSTLKFHSLEAAAKKTSDYFAKLRDTLVSSSAAIEPSILEFHSPEAEAENSASLAGILDGLCFSNSS